MAIITTKKASSFSFSALLFVLAKEGKVRSSAWMLITVNCDQGPLITTPAIG
jgi:hypothetical protein